MSSYIRKDEFYEYMADHGVSHPKVKEYESSAALQAALDAGEIDAFVHSLTEVREGQRIPVLTDTSSNTCLESPI